MRARKRNPFWGIGLDKRQARRGRRRNTFCDQPRCPWRNQVHWHGAAGEVVR